MSFADPLASSPTIARRVPLLAGLCIALIGSALIALAAKVQVPFWPVPMTLHTLAVMAIAALAGLRLAGLTLALYLLEGALGLPVFSGTPERGIGLAYMAGPTGGYLVGYLGAALIVGFAADRGARARPGLLVAAMLAGLALVYAAGALWLSAYVGLTSAVSVGVVPFLAGDLLKVGLAASLVTLVGRSIRRAV